MLVETKVEGRITSYGGQVLATHRKKELRMYDKLWDEDPEIQRGKAEAKVEASQEMIIGIVEARFPELVDLAQERVEKIRQLEVLNLLAKQIVLAPDEATARWTLGTFAA
jgi:hypothetical protein